MKAQVPNPQDRPVLDERMFQQLLAAAYTLQERPYRPRVVPVTPQTVAPAMSQVAPMLTVARPENKPSQALNDSPTRPVLELPQPRLTHLTHQPCRARVASRRFLLTDDLFWKAATAVTVAAVSALLLGASFHRFSPLPSALSETPQAVHQQAPRGTEHIVTVPAQPWPSAKEAVGTVLSTTVQAATRTVPTAPGQVLANLAIAATAQKTVVRPKRLHSTYEGEADVVAKDTVVRYGTSSAAPRFPAQTKP